MMSDKIIEGIHRYRAEYAARFNYDLRAMLEDLNKLPILQNWPEVKPAEAQLATPSVKAEVEKTVVPQA